MCREQCPTAVDRSDDITMTLANKTNFREHWNESITTDNR